MTTRRGQTRLADQPAGRLRIGSLLLATSRSSTMQGELNEAGAPGYRVAATRGGGSAFGGSEAVVVMERDPEGRTYRYIVLPTSRTQTMQEELNDIPPEFVLMGFPPSSRGKFGGKENAAILQAPLAASAAP